MKLQKGRNFIIWLAATILTIFFVTSIYMYLQGVSSKEILEICHEKLKTGGRIIIGIILIETLFSVISLMEKLPFTSVDITQITVSKSRKTSTDTMMLARNPVTIISATKS